MNIFISWSGEDGKSAAIEIRNWLALVLQTTKPFMSEVDSDKGKRWDEELAKQLQLSDFGIVCVTKTSMSSAWLNFEAGALARSVEMAHVCPVLIGLQPSELTYPLAQFQATTTTQEDFRRLLGTINEANTEHRLSENNLDQTFDTWWPRLEVKLETLEATVAQPTSPSVAAPQKEHHSTFDRVAEELVVLAREQLRILKSPEQLLPSDYLATILNYAAGDYESLGISRGPRRHQVSLRSTSQFSGRRPVKRDPTRVQPPEMGSFEAELNREYSQIKGRIEDEP